MAGGNQGEHHERATTSAHCLACLNVGKTLSVRARVVVIGDMVVEATR